MIHQTRALVKLVLNYIICLIHKILELAGFEIHRIKVGTNKSLQLYTALNFFNVDLVFDVGANTGQFAKELRNIGYKLRIVSFEPLPEAHTKLKKNSARDRLWVVHKRCALGAKKGKTIINVSQNSVSSSILPILESCSTVVKEASYVGKTNTDLITLDSVSNQYSSNSTNYFVKIDTQGYEWQVLDGAKKTLKNAKGVLCELSLVPLYQGQKKWMDFILRMDKEGFVLWEVHQEFLNPKNGRTLQINAIFFRE